MHEPPSGRLVLQGATVLTLDDASTYLEVGTVVVEGNRITAVEPGTDVPLLPDDTVVDARGKVLMPGFVDLHFHTALGKGYNDHLPLWEYLDECWYPIIRALDPEAAYWAAMLSYTEALKCGVTTVNDMYRQLGALAEAAEEIGVRAVLSNDVALAEHRLDTLEDNALAHKENHGRAGGRITVRVGIEWLPLASPELLRDARALADDLGTGIHVHLNESMSEVEDSVRRFGKRPTELAHETGLLGPDCVAAHCVWLDDREIAMMAETSTRVSHNPSSNAKLGNGIARVPEMLEAGILVGLGHDAVECNNSGDMFEVMKFASLVHRAQRSDATLMPAGDVVRMATRAGAEALGIDAGRIEVGALADLVLLNTDNVMFTPWLREDPRHLESHLVYSANGSCVDTTVVDGRIVVSGGELRTADERTILEQAQAAFRRISSSLVVVRR